MLCFTSLIEPMISLRQILSKNGGFHGGKFCFIKVEVDVNDSATSVYIIGCLISRALTIRPVIFQGW